MLHFFFFNNAKETMIFIAYVKLQMEMKSKKTENCFVTL